MATTTAELLSSFLTPEAIGVCTSLAALTWFTIRLTFKVGARFREHELKELKMQEQLNIHEEELERILKHLNEHYCLSHEDARKFLHYHIGNSSDLRHN